MGLTDTLHLVSQGGAVALLTAVLWGGYKLGARVVEALLAIERRLATLEEQARRYHDRETPP